MTDHHLTPAAAYSMQEYIMPDGYGTQGELTIPTAFSLPECRMPGIYSPAGVYSKPASPPSFYGTPTSWPGDESIFPVQHFTNQSQAPSDLGTTLQVPTQQATRMRRACSLSSNASSTGASETQKERSYRALHEANLRSQSTQIQPSPPSRTSPAPSPARSDSAVLGKAQTKKSRRRPDKLRCVICTKEVCGDHEYNRHMRLVHAEEGYRWVVICPTEKGLAPLLALKKSLDNCKSCKGKKSYGANYNAAAHMRRCHFNAPAQLKNAHGKLGGNSGGTWPSIRYLEYYHMKIIKVRRRTEEDGPGDEWIAEGEAIHTEKRGQDPSKTNMVEGFGEDKSEADITIDDGEVFNLSPAPENDVSGDELDDGMSWEEGFDFTTHDPAIGYAGDGYTFGGPSFC